MSMTKAKSKKKPAKKPARALTPQQERGILDFFGNLPDMGKLMKGLAWWNKWKDSLTQASKELMAILNAAK